MQKFKLISVFTVILLLPFACGEKKVELATDVDKISYSLGINIGRQLDAQLKDGGFDVNSAAFSQAIEDVITGGDIMLTEDEMLQYLNMAMSMQQQQGTDDRIAINNLTDAKLFLQRNKLEDGVIELPSGLQYKVIKEGTGAIPTVTDIVKVHYHGTFMNTQVFDSSVERGEPSEFPVNGVIKGWVEALQLMKVGSKWQLFVPPDLAYGEQVRGSIPPNTLLIFEVELLEIVK